MRRIYLPTVPITGLAVWLSWRGFQALGQDGFIRSVDAGRFQLAGPVVLGFVLAVCVLEQIWPAERRPLLARGHRLDFGYAVLYALLEYPGAVLSRSQIENKIYGWGEEIQSNAVDVIISPQCGHWTWISTSTPPLRIPARRRA